MLRFNFGDTATTSLSEIPENTLLIPSVRYASFFVKTQSAYAIAVVFLPLCLNQHLVGHLTYASKRREVIDSKRLLFQRRLQPVLTDVPTPLQGNSVAMKLFL